MNLHQSRDGIRELRATLANGERNLTHRGRNHRSRHNQLGDNDPLLSVCSRVFGVDDQSQKVSAQSVDLCYSRTECVGAVGIQQHWHFRHRGPPRNVRRYIYARRIFRVKGNIHTNGLLKRAQPQFLFSNSFSSPASLRRSPFRCGDATRPDALSVTRPRIGATPSHHPKGMIPAAKNRVRSLTHTSAHYRSSKYRYAANATARPMIANGSTYPTSVFSMPCN